MFNKYSRKLLVALLIVVAFFAFSAIVVSAQDNLNGNQGGNQYGNNNGGNNGDGNNDHHNDDHHASPTPTFTPTPTPGHEHEDCNNDDYKKSHHDECDKKHQDCDDDNYRKDHHDECDKPTITPVPTVTVTPTPTVTPTTAPSNPGGSGGSGVSDGRSDGLSSCPSCTQAPQGQVLGASVGPQVLGLSYTSGEESVLPQLLQIFGALTSAGFGLIFLKKNA